LLEFEPKYEMFRVLFQESEKIPYKKTHTLSKCREILKSSLSMGALREDESSSSGISSESSDSVFETVEVSVAVNSKSFTELLEAGGDVDAEILGILIAPIDMCRWGGC